MIKKLSIIGIIFYFLCVIPSNLPAQIIPAASSMDEEFSNPKILTSVGTTSPLSLDEEDSRVKASELAISDDPEDDFNLGILSEEMFKTESDFDIPILVNERVERFIQRFQTTSRGKFVIWLARSGKYIPMMREILKKEGLPEDLVYMAFIESGFDPYAYSRSKAVGPWQFMHWTGKRYGLNVDWWVDERRDPEKSTLAAAKYLKDLYGLFSSWHLAAAGYNAGEYKIIRAMKRYRTEDFWKLTQYRYLRRETKDYVPLMFAAALVAKNPEKYGFTDIQYQDPLRYELVKVPELTGLVYIADACETSIEEIKNLNPEIRRGITPPHVSEYEIKIPYGKRELFLRNFAAMQPLEDFPFRTHLVKKGETTNGIARLYRVDIEPLLDLNGLNKTSPLSKGMTLCIPISKDDPLSPPERAKKKYVKSRPKKVAPSKESLPSEEEISSSIQLMALQQLTPASNP